MIMDSSKLFDYEKNKDQFFINRINDLLQTDYEVEDLYNKTYEILRKLTAKDMIRSNDISQELLGEFISFIEELKSKN